MHNTWKTITQRGHRLVLGMVMALGMLGAGAIVVYADGKAEPGFSLAASPASQTVALGDQTTFTVTIARSGGFTGPVTLSVRDLPKRATATWSPAGPVSGTSSTVTIATQSDTEAGSFKPTVTGTATVNGKSVSQSVTVKLVVEATSGFPIAGSLASSPRLGGPGVPLNLALTNPYNQPLTISSIGVQIASITSTSGGCGTNNFSVTQMPTSYAVTVPANSTKTLDQLGSQYKPSVRWIDLPVPQNACLGATLKFNYSANGTTVK